VKLERRVPITGISTVNAYIPKAGKIKR